MLNMSTSKETLPGEAVPPAHAAPPVESLPLSQEASQLTGTSDAATLPPSQSSHGAALTRGS